jgi:HD-GYP domain-containing protein (c-di-GMP phosphodiesterase class II)
MTSARPYKQPRTRADAMAELARSSGTHFDPSVIDALIDELGAAVEPYGTAAA